MEASKWRVRTTSTFLDVAEHEYADEAAARLGAAKWAARHPGYAFEVLAVVATYREPIAADGTEQEQPLREADSAMSPTRPLAWFASLSPQEREELCDRQERLIIQKRARK